MATTYFQILQQLVVSLQNGGIPGDPGVSARRKPLLLPGDSIPRVIVWPGKAGERDVSKQFKSQSSFGKTGVWWLYPVNVAYIIAGNREVEKDLEPYLEERQAIRDIIYQLGSAAVAGGPIQGVFDVEPFEPEEVFELEAFLKGNYDVTGFQANFLSSEYLKSG